MYRDGELVGARAVSYSTGTGVLATQAPPEAVVLMRKTRVSSIGHSSGSPCLGGETRRSSGPDMGSSDRSATQKPGLDRSILVREREARLASSAPRAEDEFLPRSARLRSRDERPRVVTRSTAWRRLSEGDERLRRRAHPSERSAASSTSLDLSAWTRTPCRSTRAVRGARAREISLPLRRERSNEVESRSQASSRRGSTRRLRARPRISYERARHGDRQVLVRPPDRHFRIAGRLGQGVPAEFVDDRFERFSRSARRAPAASRPAWLDRPPMLGPWRRSRLDAPPTSPLRLVVPQQPGSRSGSLSRGG